MIASADRRVTLTFDNGPTPGVTEGVLEVLTSHGIRATFFVVGNDLRARDARAIAENAAAMGHWIGNHTMTHSVQLGDVPDTVAVAEIERAQEELDGLSHPDRLFRPYGGGGMLGPHLLSRAAVDALERGRYTCVLWNSVPRDWEDPCGWVERCLADIVTRDWSLVVLHDTRSGAMTQLSVFLDALECEGVKVTQDFPDACVPLRCGVRRGPLEHLMQEEGERRG